MSLNDHPAIRRAFDGFHIEAVEIKYTDGGGFYSIKGRVAVPAGGRTSGSGGQLPHRRPSTGLTCGRGSLSTTGGICDRP